MGNPATLRPKPFTSENQPVNRGSRKGIPNRSTLFKKIGKVKVDADSLDGEKVTVTADEKAVIAAYKKAHEGDVKALALILDSLYGKIADKTELTGDGGKDLFPQKFIVEIVNNDGDGGSDKN
jgi:hypothetical protein